jgi:hypothetical protein
MPSLKFSYVDFGILSLDRTGTFRFLNLLIFYPKGFSFPAVLLKITVFWDVMPCTSVNRYHLFRENCCTHILSGKDVFIPDDDDDDNDNDSDDDDTLFLENSLFTKLTTHPRR